MKKVFMLTVVLIEMIFLVSCGQQTGDQTQPTSQSTTQQQGSQPTQTVVTETPLGANQSYKEIPEFHFKMPLDTTLTDEVTFKIISLSEGAYSSAKFISKTGECDLGTIAEISGTPEHNITGDAEFYKAHISEIKQFKDFFLFYQGTQTVSCASEYVENQTKLIQALTDGIKNANLIK